MRGQAPEQFAVKGRLRRRQCRRSFPTSAPKVGSIDWGLTEPRAKQAAERNPRTLPEESAHRFTKLKNGGEGRGVMTPLMNPPRSILALLSIILAISSGHALAASSQEPRTIWSSLALKAVRQIVLPTRPPDVDPEFEGTVTVEIIVSKTGAVRTASATTGPDVFFAQAETAALEWKFMPFISQGTAIEARTQLAFRFVKDGRILVDGPAGVLSGPAGAILPIDEGGSLASSVPGVKVEPGAKPVSLTAEFYERMDRLDTLAIHKEAPTYPAEARTLGIQGSVVVQMHVGYDGDVKKATIVSGPVELRQAALDAARRWKFARNTDEKKKGDIAFAGLATFNFRRQ